MALLQTEIYTLDFVLIMTELIADDIVVVAAVYDTDILIFAMMAVSVRAAVALAFAASSDITLVSASRSVSGCSATRTDILVQRGKNQPRDDTNIASFGEFDRI
jgi:hypothetical protein